MNHNHFPQTSDAGQPGFTDNGNRYWKPVTTTELQPGGEPVHVDSRDAMGITDSGLKDLFNAQPEDESRFGIIADMTLTSDELQADSVNVVMFSYKEANGSTSHYLRSYSRDSEGNIVSSSISSPVPVQKGRLIVGRNPQKDDSDADDTKYLSLSSLYDQGNDAAPRSIATVSRRQIAIDIQPDDNFRSYKAEISDLGSPNVERQGTRVKAKKHEVVNDVETVSDEERGSVATTSTVLIDRVPTDSEDAKADIEERQRQERLLRNASAIEDAKVKLEDAERRVEEIRSQLSEPDRLLFWQAASALVRHGEMKQAGRSQDARNEDMLYGEARQKIQNRGKKLDALFNDYSNAYQTSSNYRAYLAQLER